MSAQFFPKLSQNYIEILDDEEYYDITIEVGKDPNVKIFRAHMIILCYRSPFLRRTLASNKKSNDNVLTHIKLPNISPEIFQIILKYIYGGIISINEQNISNTLKILAAADELLLQELIEFLQKNLIENKSEWIEQHFELVYRISSQTNYLLDLQNLCTEIISKSPEKVFKSLDFTSFSEKSLISLIKRDDLQMKEVNIWEHVIKWGLEKNPTLVPDPLTWSDDDFKLVENTLQHCLPLIRFFSLSSDEFAQKVRPYKRLLNPQLYENLLNSYLDSNSEPSESILLPRHKEIDDVIDSKIVNLNIISIISRWIDNKDIQSKFVHLRELYLPYKFKLLLRGSRDGFEVAKFHELCDNKPLTVTLTRVKGTGEILGGYNPLIWKKPDDNMFNYDEAYGITKDSFIFSFKNKDNFKDSILSKVKNIDRAIYNSQWSGHGPSFNDDLRLGLNSTINKGYNNNNICKLADYEKAIRDTKENFTIEDYEVFQILKNDT